MLKPSEQAKSNSHETHAHRNISQFRNWERGSKASSPGKVSVSLLYAHEQTCGSVGLGGCFAVLELIGRPLRSRDTGIVVLLHMQLNDMHFHKLC